MSAHDAAAAPGPDEEVTVRIRTHPALCTGWGQCHRWAPDVYPLDEDGLIGVQRLEVPGELALHAWYGAQACPQRAITVIGPPEAYWVEQQRRRHEGRRS